MELELLPLVIFVMATSFSPGPNNITAAAAAISTGYKKTLPYILGIAVGFFFVMALCASMSSMLQSYYPVYQKYFSYLACAYILWLAYLTSTSDLVSTSNGEENQASFIKGALLQIVNPKSVFYGITLYSTFLLSLTEEPLYLYSSCIILSSVTFLAVSTWAMFGEVIRRLLNNEFYKSLIKLSLSLLLIFTALSFVI